jgi:uncharacterized membrane protein YhaH (DUF805 family)
MSSKAHYAVMLLPTLFIARRIIEHQTRGWLAVLAFLAVTGPLTAKGLLGKSFGDLTLAWGLPTMYVVLALLSLWRLRTSAKERYPLVGGSQIQRFSTVRDDDRLASAA